jgi:hypothetical protein
MTLTVMQLLSVLQHIRFYVINHISFLSNKYEVSSVDYKRGGWDDSRWLWITKTVEILCLRQDSV